MLSEECGVINTLGMAQSGLSTGSGSVSKTVEIRTREMTGTQRVDQRRHRRRPVRATC